MKHLSRSSRVTAFSLAALSFGAALVLTYHASGSSTAQSIGGPGRNLRHIQTCREAGICRTGEEGLIVRKPDIQALLNAHRKGCKIKRILRENAVLRCPLSVSIPNAHPERVLRIDDVYANNQIGATDVQAQGVSGGGVRVAVLDTGVDVDHPELAGKVALVQNFTTDDLQDHIGHGTHAAGIIAAQGVKEFPVFGGTNRALGVAPDAEIIAGKVCNNQGWCLEGDILSGIEWAVTKGAKVINLSLGGGSYLGHCDEEPLAAQVNWAVSQGTTVVTAAGNHGDSTEGIAVPACASESIAVGAVDSTDVRPSWSAYGEALDVSAPGAAILSPVSCLSAGSCPNAEYGWWSGTSMAAPHVTGLSALLLETRSSLTPAEIRAIITQTANDLGDAGADKFTGQGRINAASAIASLQEKPVEDSTSSSGASASSQSSESIPPPPQQDTSSSSSSSSSTSSAPAVSEPPAQPEPPREDRKNHEKEQRKEKEREKEKPREQETRQVPEQRILPPLPDRAAAPALEHRPLIPPGLGRRDRN